MSESRHVRHRRRPLIVAGIGGVILALAAQAPPVASAAGPEPPLSPAELPGCREARVMRPAGGVEPSSSSLEAVLDEGGVVVGHELALGDVRLRLGPRAIGTAAAEERILVGERASGATSLWLLNTRRSCVVWQREVPGLVYEVDRDAVHGDLLLAAVEPGSRRYLGQLRMSIDTGVTNAMLEGTCLTPCEPNDGEVPDPALIPAGAPRPVPFFGAGGWPKGTTLPFDWVSSARPPEWARDPLIAAADDASTTTHAAGPTFVFRTTAPERIRYSAAFPDFCRSGIACAWRNMPISWSIYVRPQGTDFAWGTLRWCQKTPGDGCFDLRRVALHEFGHVVGLDHPENHGYRLAPSDTVMQAVTPARPNAGSSRHSFGPCDVASLQEVYDVPDNRTPISACNTVATTLALSSSRGSVPPGGSVTLTATLRIADRDGLGKLGGAPLNGRSVKLRYRRAGSEDSWTAIWMASVGQGRYEAVLQPQRDWELEAVFKQPDDEGLLDSRSDVITVRLKEA
jgi:hypothetical protein